MKKQWKRLAALSSAAVMAAGTLLYFPSGTLQNIRWEIAASAEECYYVNGFCDDDGCTTPYQPAEDSDGDGTYEIANAGQLYWFAEQVVNGEVSLNAIFTADIVVNEGDVAGCNGTKDASWRDWMPIGDDYNSYSGILDGQGHTISGLYFLSDSYEANNIGVVGILKKGTIQNIGLENSYFYSSKGSYIAGICGYNEGGTINNCYNAGNIGGQQGVGGVCGRNTCNGMFGFKSFTAGVIKNCYNTGNITGSHSRIGGVCGLNNFTLENCYNTGDITGTSASFVGGIVGNNYIDNRDSGYTFQNCYNTGTVIGKSSVGVVYGADIYTDAQNCYYLSDAEVAESGGISGKTADEFSSGEVAYLLNGSTSDDAAVFRQNLDNGQTADALPVLDSTHGVVCSGTTCTGVAGYTNDGNMTDAIHIWDEDGFCTRDTTHYQPAIDSDNDGTYEISNAGQLYWFSAEVNSGKDTLNAVLTADITVNEGNLAAYDGTGENDWRTWTPIGCDNSKIYSGTFDGQGHVIRGLYLNDSTASYIGIFGVAEGSEIRNVGLENSYFSGDENVSGICGENIGTIQNCYDAGTVKGNAYVGGIAGCNYETVANCYSIGTIAGTSEVGGIAGGNQETIENCYYLSDSESDNDNGTFGKTTDQFASGEVCHLLNGDQSNIAFYQNLSTEKYPTLNADSKQVCRLELTYDESFGEDAKTKTSYHNSGDKLEESPDKAYIYQYFKDEEQLDKSYTLTGDTAITVKKVPVEIELSEEFDAMFLLTYQKSFGSLDLTEFVKNFADLKSIQFKLDTDSALPEGLTLTEDGMLSGTPEKAADAVKTALILTAGNGASKKATLTFRIAKADPTVEVTVDGDTHTEGDLVSELELILSGNSTKGLAKIISEIKALAAGENTLTWEFTPEDGENYNIVTGTVVVSAQTTTTTTTTTITTTTTTTANETTATTKATTATNGTTSTIKATTATSGTTSATKATTTTTKATTATSGTTSATKATTTTTKATTATSGTTSTTKATTATSGTTSATKASTSTSGTTSTTKATTTTSGTTSTTQAMTTTSGTTSTTKATTTTSGTTSTTKATTATSGTTTTTKATTATSGTTSTTKATTATSGTTTTTKATTATSGTTSTTKATTTTCGTTSTTKASTTTSGTTSATKATTTTSGTTSTTKAMTTTSETFSATTNPTSSITESNTETSTTPTTHTAESETAETTLTTTSDTTSVTNIADEDLCSWAISDYQKKAGITPANAEITARSEDACEITLTDENGNVLDIYTVDPKTGTGTDSSNTEVNLPQTGNNSMTNWLLCVGAVLFMGFGFGAVKASGVLKRKEDA